MKRIIITGGHVNNKGAQSMMFTIVDEIRKVYNEAEISVLISNEIDPIIEKKYNINFIKVNLKDRLKLSGGIFSLLSKLIKGSSDMKQREKFAKMIENTDLFIDISGFALSSKFSRNSNIFYLSHISLVKQFNKKIILFPQSFGPFNYKKLDKLILMPLIKKYLQYPIVVYTRENEGYNALKKLGLDNIKLVSDTVFHKKDNYNLKTIFAEKQVNNELDILNNSIAIIPNVNIINSENKNDIYLFYKKNIEEILKLGKNIYLMRHSTEDLKIINNIYKDFSEHENVYLVTKEYDSIEWHKILSKFDFVIASRYHSIVHSYKVGTPAIVLGWAIKYKELLMKFNQSQYQFDNSNLNIDEFIFKMKDLNNNHLNEKKIILKQLEKIQKKSLFNELFYNL